MNNKIKRRELFRPFAPAVLAEDVAEYFELDTESPYMMIAAPVRMERRLSPETMPCLGNDEMVETLRQPRSDIPTHPHRLQRASANSSRGDQP